jgi:hypothetical protein
VPEGAQFESFRTIGFTEAAKDVMPAVSWSAKAFADVLAATVNIFKDLGIMAAETFDEIIDGFNLVSGVVNKILDGDFKGALQAAKDGYQAMTDDHSAYQAQLVASDEQYQARHRQIWADVKKEAEEKEGAGGRLPAGLEKDAVALVERLKQKLETVRRERADELGVDQDYFQLSRAQEFAFWEAQLKTAGAVGKDRVALESEVNTARKAMKDEAFAQDKAALAAQLTALKGNYDAQITLAQANLQQIGKLEGEKSTHYQEAAKQLQELKTKQAEETKKVDETILATERAHKDAMANLEIQDLNWRKAQGQVSELDYLRQMQVFEDRKFQQELEGLEKRRALAGADPVELAKVNGDIQKLNDQRVAQEQKTQQELGLLTGSAGSGFMAGLHKAANTLPSIYQQFAAFGSSIHNVMANSLGKSFDQMILQGTSWKNSLISATRAVGEAVVSTFTQMAAKYVVDLGIKKTMSAFETAESAKKKVEAAAQVTAESTKATAVATGAGVTVTALSSSALAYAAATAAAVDLAAAETWAAYAGLMFVGAGLAEGQIATMEGTLAQVKAYAKGFAAFATGGVVTSPTLGLIGEAGEPEYIIPETDGKTALQKLINDVMGSTARTLAYSGASAGFPTGSAGGTSDSPQQATPVAFHGCYFIGTDKAGMAAASKQLNQIQQYYNQHYMS